MASAAAAGCPAEALPLQVVLDVGLPIVIAAERGGGGVSGNAMVNCLRPSMPLRPIGCTSLKEIGCEEPDFYYFAVGSGIQSGIRLFGKEEVTGLVHTFVSTTQPIV